MSSRAIRRLREGEKDPILSQQNDSEDEYESEDENVAKRGKAFQFMMDDSSDDESSSSSSSPSRSQGDGDDEEEKDCKISSKAEDKPAKKEEEEDLDAILSEFVLETKEGNDTTDANPTLTATSHTVVLYNNDPRDYDLDNALRNMLNGTTNSNDQNKKKRSKNSLFARQRDTWGKRPSSFIGGGLGMQMTLLKHEKKNEDEEGNGKDDIPWPYNDENIIPRDIQQWYTFDRSTTYSDRIQDYNTYIANTGDINTMAMYIADNPFIVEPMFHFAFFFFSVGENDRGMDLLKRILWVLECAAFTSLLHGYENNQMVHLMDQRREENAVFFSTLFRLAQTSCMVGCVVTSLAISRFLLSLDPMRDPCGVLMVLDYYALATMKEKDAQFLIDLVDSDAVSDDCFHIACSSSLMQHTLT